jgi:succinate dehydrogenase/fumarate reductase flavoprotein subunit
MCAALANVEEDSWEWHAFDTVKGSDFLADQDAVDIMCKEAVHSVIELERMGAFLSIGLPMEGSTNGGSEATHATTVRPR